MYNANIPNPTDKLKNSQSQIKANFVALEPFGNGVALLGNVSAAPTTSATQRAIYAKSVSGTPQLFIRGNSDGTEVDFTSSSQSANGWARLPSGILIQWGQSGNMSGLSGNVTVTFPVAFSSVYQVTNSIIIVSGGSTVNPERNVYVTGLSTAQFVARWFPTNPSASATNVLAIRWMAVGV